MTALDRNPKSLNFLNPINFKFKLLRAPNIDFYVQKANIPGFNLPPTKVSNPFIDVPFPGDHIDFDTLDIIFSVDEKMANYLELYTWLMGLGYPDDFEQYADLIKNPEWTSLATKSEIILGILDNSFNPIFHVNYHDCFPIGLSGVDFDARLSEPEPINVACSFAYRKFDIEVAS
jgi:hypothetical protein